MLDNFSVRGHYGSLREVNTFSCVSDIVEIVLEIHTMHP